MLERFPLFCYVTGAWARLRWTSAVLSWEKDVLKKEIDISDVSVQIFVPLYPHLVLINWAHAVWWRHLLIKHRHFLKTTLKRLFLSRVISRSCEVKRRSAVNLRRQSGLYNGGKSVSFFLFFFALYNDEARACVLPNVVLLTAELIFTLSKEQKRCYILLTSAFISLLL